MEVSYGLFSTTPISSSVNPYNAYTSASVLWITKRAKNHEKHETFSRLSPPFVSFVVQTLHHPNLLLRQPIQLIHQRVSALDHETSEKPRKARTPFASFASFRVIRGPNPPPPQSPPPSTHTTHPCLPTGRHQRVNLPVRGLDLPLVEFLVGGDGGGRRIARFRLTFRAFVQRSGGIVTDAPLGDVPARTYASA